MPRVSIRLYQELNDFLPRDIRAEFDAGFAPGCTVKALIEDLGVPHTEVDLILVDGESVGFSHRLHDGERISVYPVFESWDIGGLTKVRPRPLRVIRFVCDVHLGKLASFLRLFGFDTGYGNDLGDEELLAISLAQERIILTRDRGLLKRRETTHGYCVRSTRPRDQVREIFRRFDLTGQIRPFSRCISCNERLEPVEKARIASGLPPIVADRYDRFSRCPRCGKVFWRGTHWERMKVFADEVLGGEGAPSS
jgi:uncharacterized protein with PIN domain